MLVEESLVVSLEFVLRMAQVQDSCVMDFLKCQRSGVGFSAIASDELENVREYKVALAKRRHG